jgi:nitrogen PTS system EIIA component
MNFDLADALIAPSLDITTKKRVFAAVADMASGAFGVDKENTLAALLAREAVAPTGVGHGVAIPHCQIEGLDTVRAVFLRLAKPVDYGSVDGVKVDLVVALLAPPDCGSEHLRALARVARHLRSPQLRNQVRLARTSEAIRALLATHVQAAAA